MGIGGLNLKEEVTIENNTLSLLSRITLSKQIKQECGPYLSLNTLNKNTRIITMNGETIGICGFLKERNEIYYLLFNKYRGLDLSETVLYKLTKKVLEEHPEINEINLNIHRDNLPSIKAAQTCKYVESESNRVLQNADPCIDYLQFSKKRVRK